MLIRLLLYLGVISTYPGTYVCYRKGWTTVAAPGLSAASGSILFEFKILNNATKPFVLCAGFARDDFQYGANNHCNTDMALGMDSISWAVSSDNRKGHGYSTHLFHY
jgi:hypothetical protein